MSAVAAQIVEFVFAALLAAVRSGKQWREAMAVSLREAAAKIEAGELLVDDAIERARKDLAIVDDLYPDGR